MMRPSLSTTSIASGLSSKTAASIEWYSPSLSNVLETMATLRMHDRLLLVKQLQRPVGLERPAKVIPLPKIASQRLETLCLFPGLDPHGNHQDTQGMRHCDNRGN